MPRSPFPTLIQDWRNGAPEDQVVAWEAVLSDPLPELTEVLGRWGHSQEPLDVATARFAKSASGFALAHARPDPWPSLAPALDDTIRARLGLVLRAHRTWQVGQVLGHALSGAAQDDLEEWDKDAQLREQWGLDREGFLRNQARLADRMPSAWAVGDHPVALPADQHCFIAPPRPEEGDTPARLGVIALGICVVQHDWAVHAHRLAESVRNVSAMARHQMWAGEPNPYHGFRVLPFCCHSGMFAASQPPPPATATPATPMGPGDPDSQAWHAWLADAPLEDVATVARAPFWTLFSHPQTTPPILEQLQGLNPHILGCDTLPLYEHLAIDIAAGPAPRDRPCWVLGQALGLARALLRRDLTAPVPLAVEHGVARILVTLARLPHHHLKAFPVARRDVLPAQERQALGALGQALDSLGTAVGVGPWAAQAGPLAQASAHARALSGD